MMQNYADKKKKTFEVCFQVEKHGIFYKSWFYIETIMFKMSFFSF